MATSGRRVSWWIGGLAGGGVLATHWLTYRIAVPGHHRAHVLHETGHDSWPLVTALLLTLATVASMRASLHAFRGAARPPLVATACRLAAVQALLWIAVEVGERAAAGRLVTVDDHSVLIVGLVVQLAIALLGAVLVWLGHRALSTLAARRRAAPAHRRRSTAHRLPRPIDTPRLLVPLTGPHGLRGPPAPLPTS